MTNEQPQLSPAGRYSTKEACRALGISRSTLARYCKKGLLRPRYLKANFRPYFTGYEIVKLWTMTV